MRCGTFRVFERRFQPIELEGGGLLRQWDDIPEGVDERLIWTMIEGDQTKHWYLSPGLHYVNRLGYVLCEKPWTDADQSRDYIY